MEGRRALWGPCEKDVLAGAVVQGSSQLRIVDDELAVEIDEAQERLHRSGRNWHLPVADRGRLNWVHGHPTGGHDVAQDLYLLDVEGALVELGRQAMFPKLAQIEAYVLVVLGRIR